MAQEYSLAVADASVIVKWFLAEAQSDYALRIREALVSGNLSLEAPAIMPFEVLNAVRFSKKSIGISELKVVGRSLSLYGIRLRSLEGEYLDLTLEVSHRNEITIYDAAYVALAEELRSVVYTADDQLVDSLSRKDKPFVKRLSEYE